MKTSAIRNISSARALPKEPSYTATEPTIPGKPTELPVVILRRPHRDSPVELLLGDRHQAQVILLRPTQLRQLLRDAAAMV